MRVSHHSKQTVWSQEKDVLPRDLKGSPLQEEASDRDERSTGRGESFLLQRILRAVDQPESVMVHLGGLVSVAFDEIGMHRHHLLVLDAKPFNQFGCKSSQRRERQTYGMKERRRGETKREI